MEWCHADNMAKNERPLHHDLHGRDVMKLLKHTIPLGIIAAGALSLSACSQGGSGDSKAVTAACNGFHQWQSSHNPDTLASATSNLDFWVMTNADYPAGGSRYGGGGSGTAFPHASELDNNMDALNLLVHDESIGDIPKVTKNVASDCNGNYRGSAPHGSARVNIFFMIMAGIAVLIVVTALALWVGISIKYRDSK